MITERTLGGLVHPEKIEEIEKELTRVIEDFDRAVNVEALRQTKEMSKQLLFSQSGNNIFSMAPCRTNTARSLA